MYINEDRANELIESYKKAMAINRELITTIREFLDIGEFEDTAFTDNDDTIVFHTALNKLKELITNEIPIEAYQYITDAKNRETKS